MRVLSFMVLAAAAGIGLTVSTPTARAQVSVEIGVAPDCPYGYYDTLLMDALPPAITGPEWFNGDGFVGAGPWFHGASDFQAT